MLKYFSGNSTHKVDPKGRVSLPAEFRKVLEAVNSSHIVVLPQMKHPDYHVVLSQTGYENLIARFEAEEHDPDQIEAIAQAIQTNVHAIPFDDVGRMVLAKDLRDKIGVSDEVRFVGRGSSFQLWRPDKHVAYEAPTKARGQELAKAMRLGGLH